MKASMKVWNAIFFSGGIGALLAAEPATQAVGKKIYEASAKGAGRIARPELSAIRKVATVDRSWHFETGTHGVLGVTKAFLAGDEGYLFGQGSGGSRWAYKNTKTEGAVTKGAITEGAITKGAITKGAITKGAITEGAITEGAITEGATESVYPCNASGSLGGRYRVVSDGWCGLAICVDGGLVDVSKRSWKDSVRWGLNFEGRCGYFGLVANLYQPLCGTEWLRLGGATSETERLFPASGFDIRLSCSALTQWLGGSLEVGSSNRFSNDFFTLRKESQTFKFIQAMFNIDVLKQIPGIGLTLSKVLDVEVGLRGVFGENVKDKADSAVGFSLGNAKIRPVFRVSLDMIGGVQRRAAAMASADLSFYNVSVLKRDTSIGPQEEVRHHRLFNSTAENSNVASNAKDVHSASVGTPPASNTGS